MRRSILLPTLLIGATPLVIAACGGGGGGGAASTASMSSPSGLVSVANVGGTKVLADATGKTLYSAATEMGKVRCVAGCTSFWAPQLATAAQAKQAGAKLHLTLGTVKRPDGKQQLSFHGLPLYTFAKEGSHELDGNGFNDQFAGAHFQWKAATTSGAAAPASSNTSSGGYGY